MPDGAKRPSTAYSSKRALSYVFERKDRPTTANSRVSSTRLFAKKIRMSRILIRSRNQSCPDRVNATIPSFSLILLIRGEGRAQNGVALKWWWDGGMMEEERAKNDVFCVSRRGEGESAVESSHNVHLEGSISSKGLAR